MSKKYKKPVSINKVAWRTIKILLTALSVALIAIVAFFIIKDGWEKFLQWFVGKWACLGAMIIVFVVTLGVWGYEVIRTIRKVSEDGE